MSEITVGKWGKNLAVRVPLDLARSLGLVDGEKVEIEARDGDILIRRPLARSAARSRAEAAAVSLRANRAGCTVGALTIRDLIDEGRH
jgi:antitoxin MazE